MTSAEEAYLQVLLQLDDGVLLLDARGEVELANEALTRWFGPAASVVRQSLGERPHETTIEELAATVRRESELPEASATSPSRRGSASGPGTGW